MLQADLAAQGVTIGIGVTVQNDAVILSDELQKLLVFWKLSTYLTVPLRLCPVVSVRE